MMVSGAANDNVRHWKWFFALHIDNAAGDFPRVLCHRERRGQREKEKESLHGENPFLRR